jgi:hypothetical protein
MFFKTMKKQDSSGTMQRFALETLLYSINAPPSQVNSSVFLRAVGLKEYVALLTPGLFLWATQVAMAMAQFLAKSDYWSSLLILLTATIISLPRFQRRWSR